MAKKKVTLVAGLAALGAVILTPGAVVAQEDSATKDGVAASDSLLPGVTVQLLVDGMVCPFCAYGLEKRLKGLAGVDVLVMRISDGLVQIREKDGFRLTQEELRREVEKAGFTLHEMVRVDE